MAAVKNGREYLSHVTETLKHRIAQLDDDYEVLGADNGMLMVTASGTAVVVD